MRPMNPKFATRRRFLQSAAALGAAPLILPSRVWSAETKPNSTLNFGFIGNGIQSRGLLGGFIGKDEVRVLAVCDVDTTRREAAKKRVDDHYAQNTKNAPGKPCDAYNDFRELLARKDIDAVVIATPDHWHAIITVAALKAGKDVYCEKPLTHNIHEAIVVMETVAATGRVLQTGSMQRSMKEFRVASELVRNGVIGKLKTVNCAFGKPAIPHNLPEEPMEPGLDWDRWQGPAPKKVYNSILSPRGVHNHFPLWREVREYGGGYVTDWGAHHLDIAQWGLGTDDSGPVLATPPEKWENAKDGAVLTYANGVTVTHGNGGAGVIFTGEDGTVEVGRGQFELKLKGETKARFKSKEDHVSLDSQLIKAEKEFLADAKIKLYTSSNHLTDFIECIRSRKKPNTNEIIGARSAICCHLMNIGYYTGQTVKWDPAKNTFASGGNPAWLTREYQNGWSV